MTPIHSLSQSLPRWPPWPWALNLTTTFDFHANSVSSGLITKAPGLVGSPGLGQHLGGPRLGQRPTKMSVTKAPGLDWIPRAFLITFHTKGIFKKWYKLTLNANAKYPEYYRQEDPQSPLTPSTTVTWLTLSKSVATESHEPISSGQVYAQETDATQCCLLKLLLDHRGVTLVFAPHPNTNKKHTNDYSSKVTKCSANQLITDWPPEYRLITCNHSGNDCSTMQNTKRDLLVDWVCNPVWEITSAPYVLLNPLVH